MASFMTSRRFLDNNGRWHKDGELLELGLVEAEIYLSRGVIRAYQTQMVLPPETRAGRRRKNALPANSY